MVDTGMAPRALLALAALAGVARGELGAPCMKSNAADSSTQQCMPFCKADKSHQGHCSMCKCKACKPCGGAVAMAPSPPPVPRPPPSPPHCDPTGKKGDGAFALCERWCIAEHAEEHCRRAAAARARVAVAALRSPATHPRARAQPLQVL